MLLKLALEKKHMDGPQRRYRRLVVWLWVSLLLRVAVGHWALAHEHRDSRSCEQGLYSREYAGKTSGDSSRETDLLYVSEVGYRRVLGVIVRKG